MTTAQYDAKFLKSMKIKPEPIPAVDAARIARKLIAESEQFCEEVELTPEATLERLRRELGWETEERG